VKISLIYVNVLGLTAHVVARNVHNHFVIIIIFYS
jgi:hypothetical protein